MGLGKEAEWSLHEKIFILRGEDNNDLNWLNYKIKELVNLALHQDAPGIKLKLKEIIPEYPPFDINQYKSFNNS
jgi:hypothetical protein